MQNTALVITSIANDTHPVLNLYATEANKLKIPFIVIGDTKSPVNFNIQGCKFYSIAQQITLGLKLAEALPTKHYARKNIGYLTAIKGGAEIIVETDDDNIAFDDFWSPRSPKVSARHINKEGWANAYKYFSNLNIWPRGYDLQRISEPLPPTELLEDVYSPIQQGLADDNPDVDAIYRLTLPLPVKFDKNLPISLGPRVVCPFNSQNTTWFKDAFPLLYLPSYCSFRMTDIWRSFIAQRIAWTCGWVVTFHKSTVRQERNDHNLMNDFEDEISGYLNNSKIVELLDSLPLKNGVEYIFENLQQCYEALVSLGVIGEKELPLLRAWIFDLKSFI